MIVFEVAGLGVGIGTGIGAGIGSGLMVIPHRGRDTSLISVIIQ